jgi:hypothetical protein
MVVVSCQLFVVTYLYEFFGAVAYDIRATSDSETVCCDIE